MEFLRNIWYAAIWSQELKPGELVAHTFLEEPLVFYRKTDGTPAALFDVCPHRFAPLHLGKLRGDNVRCPYHGLEFDGKGACVRNPHGNEKIPSLARVRSYPVVDRHSLVWIWMGQPELADPTMIPDFAMLDEDSGYSVSRRDWLLMEANYELITDNLLDLSHTAFLHEGILGSEETIKAEIRIEQNGTTLFLPRSVPNAPVPGFFDLMFKRDGGRVDLWADMRWDPPGCFKNDTGVTAPGASRSQGTGIYGMHFLTPVTATTTMYLFAAVRQNPVSWGEPLDTEIQRQVADLRRFAFEQQDQVIIRAQQQTMARLTPQQLRPVLLEIDIGPARYRQIIKKLMSDERAAQTAAQ